MRCERKFIVVIITCFFKYIHKYTEKGFRYYLLLVAREVDLILIQIICLIDIMQLLFVTIGITFMDEIKSVGQSFLVYELFISCTELENFRDLNFYYRLQAEHWLFFVIPLVYNNLGSLRYKIKIWNYLECNNLFTSKGKEQEKFQVAYYLYYRNSLQSIISLQFQIYR